MKEPGDVVDFGHAGGPEGDSILIRHVIARLGHAKEFGRASSLRIILEPAGHREVPLEPQGGSNLR